MSDATAISSALNEILGNEEKLEAYCDKCVRVKARTTIDHLTSAAAHAERLGYSVGAEELLSAALDLEAQLA